MAIDESPSTAPLRSIGWGLFLASSWTWCIGAFLPILLLRDWGWRGFAVFAIPNVLGAAAVGFFWTRERSRAFTSRRAGLLAWFSAATIAYQAFFLAWLAAPILRAACGWSPFAWTAWLVVSGAFALVVASGRSDGRRSDGLWMAAGAIVTLASFALWGDRSMVEWPPIHAGLAPESDLWMLAPVIALGFIVCPHLDLSFHRVVKRDGSRIPWIVFVPAFTALILLTAALAISSGVIPRAASSSGPDAPFRILSIDAVLIALTFPAALWWFVQVSFTAALHARELRASTLPGARALVPIAVVMGAIAGSPAFGSEAMYLRFLGLYGAVFPALALLLWRNHRFPVIVAYLVIALPAFEAGFLGPPWGDGARWAWAPLIPVGLLLGLTLRPMNNEQRAATRGS